MPRRKKKQAVVQTIPQGEDKNPSSDLIRQEVERQSAAIRANREVEIERILTELRLMKSCFTEEQLRTPAVPVLRELLPNIDLEREICDLESREKQPEHSDIMSFFSSVGYSALSGVDLISSAVQESYQRTNAFEKNGLASEGQYSAIEFGIGDAFKTPGFSSQRLSIGMTPKTLRIPKPGEMLLSVHGTPLGVFKEDNMEAIHESDEG